MRQALIAFMEQVGAKREMIAPFTSEAKNLHESLAPSMMLYTIRHVSGRIFAYLTAEDAQDRLSSQMISQKVEAATFQTLLKRDPRAMIYIGDQYYWAEELSR